MRLRRRSALLITLPLLLLGLSVSAPQAAAEVTAPTITEIHYDNTGTDAGEAIEVEAPDGFDLTGWQIVLYNGDAAGAVYDTKTLSGVVPAAGVAVQSYPANGIQNGPSDGIALARPDGTLAEFLSYEGTLTGSAGPASGVTSTDIGVAEGTATPVGFSLQKVDGTWREPAPATFGTRNDEPVVETPRDVTIAEVQGPGAASPLQGVLVRFEGVVTADLRTGGFNGLYVQTAGSGGAGHAGASTGVFVYLTSNPALHPNATIGGAVQVTGRVSEFQGLTEVTIGALTDVEVRSSANPLPPPVPLGLPLDTAGRESLEGMLVAPTGPFTVTDVFDLGGFGEVGLHAGTSPALSPTEVAEPGAPAQAVRAENLLRTIVLDDGVSTNLFNAGLEPPYLGEAPVRVGDQVSAFRPVVMSFGFGAYRLQPVRPVTADTVVADRTQFAATNPRTATPSVSGELRLGAFNVLNYFTTLRQDLGCAPTDNDCPARGAFDQAEFDVQESKIVAAINALGAEVVTLEEIENSAKLGEPVDEAVATLVAALNEEAGAGTWDYIRSPGNLPDVSLQDFIRNAIIYKPAGVVPQGASTALGDQSEPGEAFAEAREPIAQAFVPVGGGRPFTVVGNHFKSKGSAAGLPGDADQGDGQGASNATRIVQAQALRDWVAGLAASTAVEDVFLQGDFNSYSKEDPIDVLTTAGFTSLNSTPEFGTGRHSYSFDGESGSLDHILASPSAFDRVSDLDIWSINAVESRAFEYTALRQGLVDSETPYRSSDHDPEIAGIDRGTPPCTTTISERRLGPLNVTSGTTCLAPGAQVVGVVRVSAGASLVADSASVTGSVIADGAAFVALSGSHITGPVRIASTTGTVDLTGNTVTGAVLLLDNATPFASVVSGNTLRGLLGCSGNTPPPVNDGVPNTVDGAATGQCSGL